MRGPSRSTAGGATQSKLKANAQERHSATVLTTGQQYGYGGPSILPPRVKALRLDIRVPGANYLQLEPLTLGHSGRTQFMALGNLTEVGQDQTRPDGKL